MSDELKAALVDLVRSLQAGAEQVGAVAKEQLPLVVQEYLTWGAWSASLDVLFGLLLLAPGVGLLVWAQRRWAQRRTMPELERRRHSDDPQVFATIIGVIVLIFGAIYTSVAVSQLVYVLVAPRVYLIEKAAALLR